VSAHLPKGLVGFDNRRFITDVQLRECGYALAFDSID